MHYSTPRSSHPIMMLVGDRYVFARCMSCRGRVKRVPGLLHFTSHLRPILDCTYVVGKMTSGHVLFLRWLSDSTIVCLVLACLWLSTARLCTLPPQFHLHSVPKPSASPGSSTWLTSSMCCTCLPEITLFTLYSTKTNRLPFKAASRSCAQTASLLSNVTSTLPPHL